jgi:hypothetical protein
MRALTTVVQESGVTMETLILPGKSWDAVAYGAVFSLVLSHALREEGGISRDGENLIGAFKRTMLKQNS